MKNRPSNSAIRHPAEWEEQAATWLSFPHHPKNWAGERGVKIRQFYFDLVCQISKFQPVKLIVPKGWTLPEEESPRFIKCKFAPQVYSIRTNDIWIRDYGPFFVKKGEKKLLVQTKFNAWGAKFPPYGLDDNVPAQIAKLENLPISEVPYIFEGGAIEINADGLGITTLDCITGKNRNESKDLKKITNALCKAFGLRDILILPCGLFGDHTDGHIDNVARFVQNERLVVASEKDETSPNHERLLKAKIMLEEWLQMHYGKKAKVDTLPLPPQGKLGNEVLPASYMNFIYANGALLFPCYAPKTDKIAKAYFKSIYPDRKIIGIDCRSVIEEGGSLHCMSKQECL